MKAPVSPQLKVGVAAQSQTYDTALPFLHVDNPTNARIRFDNGMTVGPYTLNAVISLPSTTGSYSVDTSDISYPNVGIFTNAQITTWLTDEEKPQPGVSYAPIANISSTITVSGNVNATVTNTINATITNANIPVSQSGTWSVNISNGTLNIAGSVSVTSGTITANVAGSLVIQGTPTVQVLGSNVAIVGAASGAALGDVGAATLVIDTITSTISDPPGNGSGFGGCIASYKSASATVAIAIVGVAGTAIVGTQTSVSPTFGQNTTAGNLLTAWVTASGSVGEPTTTAAGWNKRISSNNGGGWTQIWEKPNCSASEAAPTFTSTGGGPGISLMGAQLAEWSGALTVNPQDQTGFAGGVTPTFSVSNTAIDSASGDLVLGCFRVITSSAGVKSFSDSITNNTTVTQAGTIDVSTSPGFRNGHFVYAIIPFFKKVLPMGVAPWAYDVSGVNDQNQTSVAASVVFAATPGKTYTAHTILATVGTTGLAVSQHVNLLDGASKIAQFIQDCSGTAFNMAPPIQLVGTAFKGTTGNSMTWQYDGAGNQDQQDVTIGAYLR